MLLLKFVITVYLCPRHMAWKHTTYHVNTFDVSHTILEKIWKKNAQTTFTSPSKNTGERWKGTTMLIVKQFFATRIHKNK